MHSRPTSIVLLVGGMGLWWAGGCESGGKQGRMLTARPVPYVADVPLPVGFTIVEERSRDRSTGQGRLFVAHEYTGPADAAAVRNFFRDQMPSNGWSLLSDGNTEGEYGLRFEKGSESCEIHIRRRGGLLGRTVVRLDIEPIQRGSAPPARTPR